MKKTNKNKKRPLLWRGYCLTKNKKPFRLFPTEASLIKFLDNERMYPDKMWDVVKAEMRVVK